MLVLAERAGITGHRALPAAVQDVLADVQVSASTRAPASRDEDTWAARLQERSCELSRFMPR
ncbi:hypothetical protein LO771_27785 [Streptacidiphilus sp. ASG 303]|uniref:hypothetical protein n=1 Tax=Streptacidiphilus sp. ASG 303 TaxID=2896847 RepID=UPI001E5B1D41|nr:hypothetical protein [Streptacidiphilus sp. ASG 303]MCD0486080.1 hypothetical protein [Streptacidiphilus sp. ASG 303]